MDTMKLTRTLRYVSIQFQWKSINSYAVQKVVQYQSVQSLFDSIACNQIARDLSVIVIPYGEALTVC